VSDDKASVFAGEPAIILDGALKNISRAAAPTASDGVQQPRLDRLA
jgi:hypothetical protein